MILNVGLQLVVVLFAIGPDLLEPWIVRAIQLRGQHLGCIRIVNRCTRHHDVQQ